jgi:tagatose 6-phosphate kinase
VIHAVCLNAALDITYHLPEFTPGASHRVERVTRRAGGKGVNVARVLRQLGADVVVVGFAGGDSGRAVVAELDRDAIRHRFVAVEGDTRSTVTLATGDQASVLNEPGPAIAADGWARLVAELDDSLAADDVLVLSGSVPPGVPVTAYAELIALGSARGVATVLDAEGAALRAALPAAPTVAKPNAIEAVAALGLADDPVTAARALVAAGARNAAVSCGADGVVAVVERRALRVRLPERVPGNPTGAGDALTAGIARGLASGASWTDLLCDAVALAAGAVAVDHAGAFDETVRARVRAGVEVEEV